MDSIIDLIGDGIENPWNAKTMMAAAQMFGADCYFRDRKKLIESAKVVAGCELDLVSLEQFSRYSPIVALENTEKAADIYGCRLADRSKAGPIAALIAGNERFGIAQDMLASATQQVQIPMASSELNTINVAAASAVALYYLTMGSRSRMQIRANPNARRPHLLLMGATDHHELGSSIRSAAAFGWNRLLVEDRENIWFGCERSVRAGGRGAARRARNSIRVIPVESQSKWNYKWVSVISTEAGAPLAQSNLARGDGQILIVPDEHGVQLRNEDWARFGTQIEFVRIELPNRKFPYHYRLPASIALAEAARQIGRKTLNNSPGRRHFHYDSFAEILDSLAGELVMVEDLAGY